MASRAEAVRQRQQAILAQVKPRRCWGASGRRDYGAELNQQLALVNPNAALCSVLELQFDPTRRWKVDLAFPYKRLAVEVEGVVYSNKGDNKLSGRHVSVTGFEKDCEKYAALAIAGWRLIRVMPKHVTNGQALAWIEAALKS